MDAQNFLKHVVAPGAYYAFAYKRPGAHGLNHKFFKQTDLAAAVAWVRHIANENDVWHAVASFKEPRRRQTDAENLQAFWYDADIKRPGDGKDPAQVWSDITEVIGWLVSVRQDLPMPNLWMSSGYGVHFYWVLDKAIPAADWVVYAKKFRAHLGALGARGDIGITADSARILRPPETFNYKVPTDRKLCRDITPARLNLPLQYSLSLFTTGVTISPLGSPPNRKISSKLNEAAKSGREKPPTADFAAISTRCLQVQKSLAEHGEHDKRQLWHLFVNLTYFCDDREAAHQLGNKHPDYSEDETDAKFDQTSSEHKSKQNFGAPACDSFDVERKGVCDQCPFRSSVKGPYNLGFQTVLPSGYRQLDNSVERTDKDGGWVTLIEGVVSNAQLLDPGEGGAYQLTFEYGWAGKTWPIRIDDSKTSIAVDKIRAMLAPQRMQVDRYNAGPLVDFLMAWIKQLREALKVVDAPPPFGWVHTEGGGYAGLCVGGTFYRTDGTEGAAMYGDPTIRKNYNPQGDITVWRKSAEFVVGNKPELQVILAAAFAAPLMEFVGESGILSVWSGKSGARKTSAFRVGTAVWCNPITGMSAIRDTPNSVQHSLAETRFMPVYWDEIHAVSKEHIAVMVEMFFNITQGRGRARLDARIEQRSVGYWRTLMTLSANKPAAEIVEQDRAHTNAGAMRLFEYEMEPIGAANPNASTMVQQTENNYGQAGRVYAQWAATHVDKIQDTIKAVRARLYKDVPDIRADERFHVAVVIGITAGAIVATELNLVTLSVKDIYEFLKSKLRSQRDNQQADKLDDGEKFEKFVADSVDDMLITQSYATAGRPKTGAFTQDRMVIKQPGIKCARALIHISLDDKEMRFDYNAFKAWCFRNHESYMTIIGHIEKQWGTTRTRAVMSIGTDWSSGAKVYYYRLPLTAPELGHHLRWGMPTLPDNVVPLRPPPAAAE